MSAGPPTEAQVIEEFQRRKGEADALFGQLNELDAELAEHKLVLRTLEPLEPSRRCFRLVGGVLVERTVGEVAPAVARNAAALEDASVACKARGSARRCSVLAAAASQLALPLARRRWFGAASWALCEGGFPRRAQTLAPSPLTASRLQVIKRQAEVLKTKEAELSAFVEKYKIRPRTGNEARLSSALSQTSLSAVLTRSFAFAGAAKAGGRQRERRRRRAG